MKTGQTEVYNLRHVERNEELEVGAGILSSLVSTVNLIGLPGINANVKGKGINAVVVSKSNVLQPGVRCVRVGVAHHMVGSHDLVIAVSLESFQIVKKSGNGTGQAGGNNFELERLH